MDKKGTCVNVTLSHITEGRISSGGPGRAERIGEHSIHAPTRSRDFERFLKITVRHITDGQVRKNPFLLWQFFLGPAFFCL